MHAQSDAPTSYLLIPLLSLSRTCRPRPQALFSKWDVNDNGSLSLAEVDDSMKLAMRKLRGKVHQSATLFWGDGWNSYHRPLMRHFVRVRDVGRGSGGGGLKPEHVMREEFRLLLLCMRQYFQLSLILLRWGIVYVRSAEHFRRVREDLERWGLRLGEYGGKLEAEAFRVLDEKGFEPFLRWAGEEGRLEWVEEDVSEAKRSAVTLFAE